MYTLTIQDTHLTFQTLGDVLVVLNAEDRSNRPTITTIDEVEVHREGRRLTVCRNTYGRYGVQQPGTAKDVFESMFGEVERHYLKPHGVLRAPHEMPSREWMAVIAIGSATFGVYPCFTKEQYAERCEIAGEGPATRAGDVSDLCRATFYLHCGWDHNGPLYDGRQTNCRHEVHVAYALARGTEVPAHVLEEYLDPERKGDWGLGRWFRLVLDNPAFRGVRPVEALQPFASVLHHNGIEVTETSTPLLIDVLRAIPLDCRTSVQIEDFLYQRKLLKPLPVPPQALAPASVDESAPALARAIRDLVAEARMKGQIAYLRRELSAGRISRRQFERDMAIAQAIPTTETLVYGMKVSRAIEERDVEFLLDILDTARDSNVSTKKAIEQEYGLKILGLPAAARRASIFRLCGFDAVAQQRYEEAQARQADERRRAADRERAENLAAASRWRLLDGRIVSGKEYVDDAIAKGFNAVVTSKRGNAMQYWLTNRSEGRSVNLLAKDGTADYARLRLEELGDAAPMPAAA